MSKETRLGSASPSVATPPVSRIGSLQARYDRQWAQCQNLPAVDSLWGPLRRQLEATQLAISGGDAPATPHRIAISRGLWLISRAENAPAHCAYHARSPKAA